jgi:hypothetical protein
MRKLFVLLLLFLTACTPTPAAENAETTPQLISVYIAPSLEELLPQIYRCAEQTQIGLVRRTPSIAEAQISLRIGARNEENAYQIGEVTLAVIGNAQNPVQNLSEDEVIALYTGKTTNWATLGGDDAPVRLWVYNQEDDLQRAFNTALLTTAPLSTLARQAQSPREMREAIANDTAALGILIRSQTDERINPLYSLGKFPVLAVLQEKPQESTISFLICLQEK